MPGGFTAAYLTALIPSLWRKKIVPKLLEWDEKQAERYEYPLIREANRVSGWTELTQSVVNTSKDSHRSSAQELGY